MIRKLFSITAMLCLIATIGFAQSGNFDFSNMNAQPPIDKNVRIGTLANGLKYYVRANKTPEKHAHLRIIVKTGSAYEDDDQQGLAHFCEHMAFNGTKLFPKNEILNYLQKMGLQFGNDVNAGTGMDETQYELPIPTDNPGLVDTALLILREWAHNVSYDDDDIDNERGVIISEWRQRNNTNFRILQQSLGKLFYNSKYAVRNGIGDTAFLNSFPHSAIKRFYKEWYRPDIMAVVAVGDFDPEYIEKKIVSIFSEIPKYDNPRPREVIDMPFHKETLVAICKDKELTTDECSIYIKLPKSQSTTLQEIRNNTRNTLFGIMMNQRYAEIVRKPNPPFLQAGAGRSGFMGNKDAYFVGVATKTGDIMKGLDAALAEQFRLKQHGFLKSELERAKTQYMTGFEKIYKEKNKTRSSAYVNEYTKNFTDGDEIPGIDYEYEFYKKFVPEISLEEMNSLIAQYLTKENCVFQVSLAEKDGAKYPTEEEFIRLWDDAASKSYSEWKDVAVNKPLLKKKIKPGKITDEKRNEKLGTVELTLSNGTKAILKKTNYKDDEILFRAYRFGGASLASDEELPNASQAASFISQFGLGELDNTSLQKALTGKIASAAPFIDENIEGLNGGSSVKDQETMFQLIHLYFTAPRTDNEAFKSIVERIGASLENNANSPESIFADTIQTVLAGYNKREVPFTKSVLEKINIDKLYDFYNERYSNANGFTFFFVGNFDVDSIKQFIAQYIGSLPSNEKTENFRDNGVRTPKGSLRRDVVAGQVDKSTVKLFLTGDFDWSRKNRYEFNAMAEVLEIKFLEVIREKLSGVYSPAISGYVSKYPVPTYTVEIDFICQPERVDELIAATKELFKEMQKNSDDVATAKVKKNHEVQYKQNFERNEYWLSSLYNYNFYGESPEYILNFMEYVNGLSANDVQRSAKKYLKEDTMKCFTLMPQKN